MCATSTCAPLIGSPPIGPMLSDLVRPGHRRAASDDVVLAQHLVELEMQIREGGAQRRDDLLEVRSHVGAIRLLMVDRGDGDGVVDVSRSPLLNMRSKPSRVRLLRSRSVMSDVLVRI